MRHAIAAIVCAIGLAGTAGAAESAAGPTAKSGVRKAGEAVQETGAKTQAGVKRGLKRADRGVRRGVDAASRGVNKAKKRLHVPDGPAPAPRQP